MTEIKTEPFTKEEEEALNFCLEDKVRELLAEDYKKKLDKEILGKETKDTRKILDSGERRQFDSGAVRDIQEGKGRCDLLPLGVVARYFELLPPRDITSREHTFNNKDMSDILFNIHNFLYTRNVDEIYKAIATFIKGTYGRDAFAIMELSKHYEEGAKKYADRNWEKGIPLHCYIDSGIRHLMKYYDDWTDEPHDRAFMWNMFGLLWTYYHKPEMDDLPRYSVEESGET